MSAVALPAIPWQAKAKPSLVRFGGPLTPPLGGPMQRINRLGSRFSLQVSLPPMDEGSALAWIAARSQADATNSTLIVNLPNPPAITAIGTPLVNGASQAGILLAVKGLNAGAVVAQGRFFSVAVSGRNYLYHVTAAATADGSGHATLSISPKIRAAMADGASLNFSAPQIEGFDTAPTIEWDVDELVLYGLAFTLMEAQ